MAKVYTWKLKEKIYDGRGIVTQLKLMMECEDGDKSGWCTTVHILEKPHKHYDDWTDEELDAKAEELSESFMKDTLILE